MKFLRTIPIWVWLIIVAILPLLSLLTPGLPITHDGPDHVARIANFYASIQEGIVVPRWAANLNWGYGHPILMFLYPLSSYAASLFHLLGFSFVDSTKLVFAVGYIASTLAMYLWMRRMFGEKPAVVGALLYSFAPYRFVDLYVRGAIGEHMAFIFPPLVCYFLLRLSEEKSIRKNIIFGSGLALSFAGLMLAHNAIALMMIPIFILYGIYLLIFESTKKMQFIVSSKLSIIVGFGLSAFFWVPAFFEGKYTLRDIVTAGEVLERFVPWTHFFYSPWNFGGTDMLSKSLGISSLFAILISFFLLKITHDKKNRLFIVVTVLLLVITLALMTSVSKPIWVALTILQKFQFPWRFLSVTTILVALIGSTAAYLLEQKISKRLFSVLFIGYCSLIIFSTVGMWHPKKYEVRNESAFTGIYMSTTDTGESSPIWSIRFMEHTPSASSEVIDGEATILQTFRSTTKHMYTMTATKPSRILENTLYFPGWNTYVDGKKTTMQFQDPNFRGLMTYDISPGDHEISIQFEDTKVRKLANMISVFSSCILAGLFIITKLWKRK